MTEKYKPLPVDPKSVRVQIRPLGDNHQAVEFYADGRDGKSKYMFHGKTDDLESANRFSYNRHFRQKREEWTEFVKSKDHRIVPGVAMDVKETGQTRERRFDVHAVGLWIELDKNRFTEEQWGEI